MARLEGEDGEAYQRQFGRYVKEGIKSADLEKIYTKAHAAIRADPAKPRDPMDKGFFAKRTKAKDADPKYPKKQWQRGKISISQRKDRIRNKLQARGVTLISEEIKASARC